MAFRVGQKVVCVEHHPEYGRCAIPCVGDVYTIRGIDETDGLLLEEIFNKPQACFNLRDCSTSFGEPSFWIHRFRPLIDRSTDTGMAILRRILDDHKQPAGENV